MTESPDGARLLCHECGRWFRTLGSHIVRTHGISSDDYRDAHGLAQNAKMSSSVARARTSEVALSRIGTPEWERFATRRDATLAVSQPLATTAARDVRDGARAGREERAARMNRTVPRPVECIKCGGAVQLSPTMRHSNRRLCLTCRPYPDRIGRIEDQPSTLRRRADDDRR